MTASARPPTGPTADLPRFGWQERAACRDMDLDLFFGPDAERPTVRRRREAEALRVCAACPVVAECLTHALALPENHGVWGATTEAMRAERRRREHVVRHA